MDISEMMDEKVRELAEEMQAKIDFLASPRIQAVKWEWEKKRKPNAKVTLTLTFRNTAGREANVKLKMPDFKEGDILWGGYDFMHCEEWPFVGYAKATPEPIGTFK